MLTVFRALLCLYPAAFRHKYGEEMMSVLIDVQAEMKQKGRWGRVVSELREIVGLLSGALEEHMRNITGSYDSGKFLPRRFTMKTEFRFPKATVALMTIILAAVIMTIEKAKAISASVPHTSQTVGPIQPEQFTTVSTFLVVLASACVAGALGWAILFALHRSGSQRLSEINPQRAGN
jgi:hypothetical protein